MKSSIDKFLQGRDLLFRFRDDYESAYAQFQWPALSHFNWARDWFDRIAQGNRRTALRVFSDDFEVGSRTFSELSESSTKVALGLKRLGINQGDRLLLMSGNVIELWEALLGAFKIGAVIVPSTPQLTDADLTDRFIRGNIRHAIADGESAEKLDRLTIPFTRISIGEPRAGWTSFDSLKNTTGNLTDISISVDDPLLLYFTSGTTAKPKLVLHNHASYPIGHLSTMYWVGIQEGDVHFNVSSPGWAKHAWSNLFAPWNAGATVVAYDYRKFSADRTLEILRKAEVSTLCAPPTVWRLLIQRDLGGRPAKLKEATSAGEPLNPEVITQVKAAWGITVRDGFGQTETTAQIGNSPGQIVRPGGMGRPLPGYQVELLDSHGKHATEGEISLRLSPRPIGLMAGYIDDPDRTAAVMANGFYRTGDEARRDGEGYFFYVARGDDVFKSADYRISPFELESALLECSVIVEAAVVPASDPVRGTVPKAFIVLKAGVPATAETAATIFEFVRSRLPPYQRVRRIEFGELPKTISGKIRRVELRNRPPRLEFLYEQFR